MASRKIEHSNAAYELTNRLTFRVACEYKRDIPPGDP